MTTSQTPQLNDEDLDLLSAYLDHQVEDGERAALEARLEREPALRRALDELRVTVALLRDLPPARPPRSFTLDPAALAPRPRWLAAAGWMRLGSAIAAVLLALTVTLELVTSGRGGMAGAPVTSSSAVMATSAAAQAQIQAAPGADAASGRAAGESAAEATAAPEMSALSAPAAEDSVGATAAPAAADAPPPFLPPAAAESNTYGMESAREQPTDEAAANDASSDATTGAALEGPLTAGDERLTESNSSSPDTRELESQQSSELVEAAPAFSPLRLAQVSLIALAAILGLGSFWLSRRERR